MLACTRIHKKLKHQEGEKKKIKVKNTDGQTSMPVKDCAASGRLLIRVQLLNATPAVLLFRKMYPVKIKTPRRANRELTPSGVIKLAWLPQSWLSTPPEGCRDWLP